MHPKQFALVGGLLMIIAGFLAFIPALNVVPASGLPALQVENSYGMFMGYFPMNVLNKVLAIVLGAAGVVAYYAPATALPKSITWSRIVFVLLGVLAIFGLFEQTNTLFGYMPLFGWNIISATALAVLGAYFGFALTSRVPDQQKAPTHSHVAGVR